MVTVTIAARLEYFDNLATPNQVTINKAPKPKPMGNSVPSAVATALPP